MAANFDPETNFNYLAYYIYKNIQRNNDCKLRSQNKFQLPSLLHI